MKKQRVVWFKDVTKHDTALVGGKGANLGEMTRAGFPVPPGFIVTAEAYYDFLKENKLEDEIKDVLQQTNFDDTASLKHASQKIKSLITKGVMDEKLIHMIYKAYTELGGKEKNPLVAVRSSATAEDLPGASFAGQQETYLNVKGEANLLLRIKDAWASLFDARAIFYRHEQKYDHVKVGIAIPVQRMVESEVSGIMFSVDPVTNDKTIIVIEAIYGLGELIVQGAITPDHYEVNKADLTIKEKHLVMQTKKLVKKGAENKEVRVSKKDGGLQKLSDKHIIELATLAKDLEKHYFFPQDSEWAVQGGKVYLVQTRPVTTLKKEGKKVTQEKASKVVTPLMQEQAATSPAGDKALLLKGDPASPGIASGPVKVLKSADEIDKIVSGDILVAPQTNPDFVPAMKKAAAIVTDSGGRTCFTGNTLVLTEVGFITMKSLHDRIEEGESMQILSYDYHHNKPTWKRILSTQKNHLSTIRVAISQTGRVTKNTIDVTPDHKFFTYQKRELTKLPLQTVLSQKYALCLMDSLPQNPKHIEISSKLAYLLGALCTDGNIYLRKGSKVMWRRGSVTFTQKDCDYKSEFIQTVQAYFSEIYNYDLHPREKTTSSYIRGRLIVGQAMDYRCFSLAIALKIQELFNDLPRLATSFSEETALYFLAGVIDGDGSFHNNRIQIYASKQYVYEAIITSCLRLNIVPQVTSNRHIYNIQIVERMEDILAFSKKVKAVPTTKYLGTKLFAAKQLFEDIIDEVNYKGRIKPYITNNLLLDSRKIKDYILPMVKQSRRAELQTILESPLRMQRVNKIKDLGMQDVYNIEVEANNELDHNFVAFSNRYTPLLVSNSHAAIVSREIGIPAVVGTGKGTQILKDGMIITVNGATGEILSGGTVTHQSATREVHDSHIKTATKVYVNLAEPEFAESVAKKHVDGVGLLRAEFMMAGIGTHPQEMIHEGKKDVFINTLARDLEKFAKAFSPRPVVYRASDFKTNEYRNLKGGQEYEPVEPNPMLGFRGAYRYIKNPEVFELELEAIKKVRNKMGYKNLWLMIPFVRTVEELEEVKKIIAASGLSRGASFKLWMMVEIPSNVILLEDFIKVGIDGVSIGSNDLTMLLLGTDRDNDTVASEFNEQNPAVTWALEHIIKTCHKMGVTASLCGQAASEYPDLVEKLVSWGITSVSVSPDAVTSVRETIANAEKKILRI